MEAERDMPDFCAIVSPNARAERAARQLAALAQREATVRAFVCHDADAARRELVAGTDGPLSGALIGVKDIIATEAFPTRYGLDDFGPSGPRHDVETLDLPVPIADFCGRQQEICYWEAARILLAPGLLARGRLRLLPELVALLGPYLDSDTARYAAARRRRQTYQARFDELAAGYDAVLLPAATGAAPPVTNTGDAVMNRIWTALHVPAITVPFWRTADGMPLGLQLVAPLGADRALIETAQWFHERAATRK